MPSASETFGVLASWLHAAGVKQIIMGWYDPAMEGAPACAEPIACLLPEEGRLENRLTPSAVEEMRVSVVIWTPGNGLARTDETTWGGFKTLLDFHDRLFAGSDTVGQNFPLRTTAQLTPLPDTWQLWWWTGRDGGPMAADFGVLLKYRVGPVSFNPVP